MDHERFVAAANQCRPKLESLARSLDPKKSDMMLAGLFAAIVNGDILPSPDGVEVVKYLSGLLRKSHMLWRQKELLKHRRNVIKLPPLEENIPKELMYLAREYESIINDSLLLLPHSQVEVLLLSRVQNLSVPQVAAIIRMPEDEVSSLLLKAEEYLKATLTNHGYEF